jgi:hypothetical protein
MIDLDEILRDKTKFGKIFKHINQWKAWVAFLKAFYGLAMTEEEWAIFKECTGRNIVPDGGFDKAVLICGRRSGKTFISSFCAALTALTYQSESPGDMPQVFIVAQDKQAGKVNLAYVEAFCKCIDGAITKRNKESIELSNGVEIRTQTCSFRSSRGYHLIFLAAEEMASWRDENSANPDIEVMRALDPALEPGAKTLITSTPFARKGLLYSLYRENFGHEDSNVLVWQAPTLRMRPDYSERKIKKAFEEDRISANTEWNALWREDITTWLSEEIIGRATGDYAMLPFQPGIRYFAAVDVSGGRSDSYCLTIAHNDSGIAVVDLLEERRSPLDPLAVTKEFAQIVKGYNVGKVLGDRYAGEFASKSWENEGISYETASIDKSEAFLQFAAVMSMGKALLPKNEVLTRQLISLERKALASGKEQVDHPTGLHDDLANSTALAVCSVYKDVSQHLTPEQMEARMPVMKKHPRQTAQEAIREFNREFLQENNLMISLSEAKKLRLFKR